MTAIAVTPTTSDVQPRADVAIAAPTRTAGPATTATSVAGRTIRKFYRTPQLVVISTIQGAMFLLIFRYVFGGAINSGPIPYVDFLVPGFVMTSVLFTGMMTATGVAEDLEDGFFDRLRSLPVPRTALVGGRALADVLVATWSLAVTVAIGFAIGFRLHGSIAAGLAAFGLCVIFAFAFEWMFICIGLVAGTSQGAQGMSMLVFPLTFVSSAYVPVSTMPSWMQPIAENQPVSIMSNAVRALCLGDPTLAGLTNSTAHYVILSLIWSVGLVAVFAPIAVRRYRRG